MTETRLAPALTPEEWKEGEFESFYGTHKTSAQCDHKARWFFHSEGPDGREDVVILNQSNDGGAASHKLAALALCGQPFGFTREDVEALRNLVADLHPHSQPFASIADRIEALLPPRETE